MITDHEIDEIMKLAEHHFDQTAGAGFRGAARKKAFLEVLRIGLCNKQTGIIQGACHRCLGKGYEPDNDKADFCERSAAE